MKKEISGYKWSFINVVIKSIAQLGYTAVISRILDAEVFGVIAMATLVINFGSYFAKLGLGPAIIQKKDIRKEEKDAAFTSTLILGTGATLIVFIFAPLIGGFFNNDSVINIIRVLSISFIINAFSITPMALLSKKIRFKEIAVIEILAYIFGNLVIGISCAINGLGAWSLVFATLTQQVVIAAGAMILLKETFSFTLDKNNYIGLYSYGSKSTLNNILDYFVSNTEKFFIGKMDTIALGEYNRTNSIIVMPFEQLTVSMSRVFFPHISKLQSNRNKLKEEYEKYFMLFSTVLLSLGVGTMIAAKSIIVIVLGEKWGGIESIFYIVVLATVLHSITHFNAVLSDATAELGAKFKIQLINLTFILVVSFLIINKGTLALLIVMLIAKIMKFVMYQINTSKILKFTIVDNIKIYFYIIRSVLIPSLGIFLVGYLCKNIFDNTLIILLLQIIMGALGVVFGILILPNNDLLTILRNKFKQNKFKVDCIDD